jgi:formamidopyrimidine-DNA glycosylase
LELLASKEDLASTSVGKLGPEPFDLDLDDFYKALQKRNDPIKEALLNQTLVAGIGNIYDSEILFAAKIHPLEPCKNIKKEQLPLLKEAMVQILGRAIELGGSTIDTFHPDLGVDGRMQLELKAYGQEGMPCPECGKKIRRIMLGGRGTYYCPHCQKRMHAPLVLGVTGPIHAGKSTVSSYYVNQGFALFDADKEVKELYRDKQVQKDIKKLLGRSAFLKGKVNADYMRLALSDKKKKKALENYLDPLLLKKAKKAIADCKAPGIVLDIPRLFPSGFGDLCDEVILVESQESTRAKRLFDEGRDVDGLMNLNASYPLSEARNGRPMSLKTRAARPPSKRN